MSSTAYVTGSMHIYIRLHGWRQRAVSATRRVRYQKIQEKALYAPILSDSDAPSHESGFGRRTRRLKTRCKHVSGVKRPVRCSIAGPHTISRFVFATVELVWEAYTVIEIWNSKLGSGGCKMCHLTIYRCCLVGVSCSIRSLSSGKPLRRSLLSSHLALFASV